MDIGSLITQFMQWSNDFVLSWGYLGLFLVNLIGTASIIFPVPAFLITFAFGGILNPWAVGLFSGIGAAIGELTGYILGRGGRRVIKRRYEKMLAKTKKWIENHGAFPVIVLFAATPLPDDIIGILAGIINYDVRKFFLASLIGKIILGWILAWGGFYGIQWILSVLGGV